MCPCAGLYYDFMAKHFGRFILQNCKNPEMENFALYDITVESIYGHVEYPLPQNDCLNLAFVKDCYVVCKKND